MGPLAAWLIEALVGVSTKVVTLSLKKVGWETSTPVTVIEGEGCGEGRHWHALLDTESEGLTPASLALGNLCLEEVVKEEVLEARVLGVGILDVSEEAGTNNTATTPHERHATKVQVPTLLLTFSFHKHEALSIGDDLGGIKREADVLNHLSLGLWGEVGLGRNWAFEEARSGHALFLEGREAASEDSFADEGDRHADLEGTNGGPFTGSLLASTVKDVLNGWLASGILVCKDGRRDLNEIRVELTLSKRVQLRLRFECSFQG